jgi:hypothetical protein
MLLISDGDALATIRPLPWLAGIGNKNEEVDHFTQGRAVANQEDTRRAVPSLEVVGQEVGERAQIVRDKDAARSFGPDQNLGILASARKVFWITDLNRIDDVIGLDIVAHDGCPQPPGKILIEEK